MASSSVPGPNLAWVAILDGDPDAPRIDKMLPCEAMLHGDADPGLLLALSCAVAHAARPGASVLAAEATAVSRALLDSSDSDEQRGLTAPPLPTEPAPERAFVAPGAAVLRDVRLPDDGAADPAPMTADLHYPSNHSGAAPLPLVVVLTGFGGVKELFGMYASGLALKGYAVLVVSQIRAVSLPLPLLIGEQSALNVERPQIVRQAIDWAVAEEGRDEVPAIDTSRVFLSGHSAGAVNIVAALTLESPEAPPRPAGAPPPTGIPDAALAAPLEPLPEVAGAFLYGYTLFDRFVDPPRYANGTVDAGVPVLVANGQLDSLNFTTIGTYERVEVPKAAALLKELNHFSIADDIWLVREEAQSAVARREQVAVVVGATHLWFTLLGALRGGRGEVLLGLKLLRNPAVLLAVPRYLGEIAADLDGLGDVGALMAAGG